MNLRDIEAFIALAETGSVNRAARRLNLTQPATTRRVQNFEAALGGAALLDRRAKPPVLTPAGHQALAQCRAVLKAVTELKACNAAQVPAGDLRLGIAHGLGEIVIGSPLDELARKFPGVRLRVATNWTTRLIEELRAGALDCAIGMLGEAAALPSGVTAATLGEEEVVVVAPKTVGRKKARPRLAELARESWVLNPDGCGCRTALERALDRANAEIRIGAEIFGEELQLSYIARSGGLGLVPRRQLESAPQRQRLQVVPVADFRLRMSVAMLHGPALGRLSPAVAFLRQRVAARIDDNK